MLSLKRFYWNDAKKQTQKIQTAVDLSRPVVFTSKRSYAAYQIVAVVNHHGSSFACGHYTLDREVDGCIKRFNDAKVSSQLAFDDQNGYVLLLKKMDFSRSSSIIRKYIERKSQLSTNKEERSVDKPKRKCLRIHQNSKQLKATAVKNEEQSTYRQQINRMQRNKKCTTILWHRLKSWTQTIFPSLLQVIPKD